MSNKFNQFGSSGDSNVTNGSLDIYGYSLRAENLNPNEPLKTNSIGQLISSNLNISDINNLQTELNATIQTPYTDGDIEITNGNLIAKDIVTDTILSLNTSISNLESSVGDKLNKTGDTMSGNLDMGGNSITDVFSISVDEIKEKTLGNGIYTNNTLYTTDVVVTGSNTIKTDKIQEATLTDGINVLSDLHMNVGTIDDVFELKCDSIDSRGGLISVSFPSNLNTPDVICDVIREKTLLGGVTCKNNLNMFGKNINNTLGLYTDNIYERTGLLGINIRNNTDFNSKIISNVGTLTANTLIATITETSNLQNPTPATAIFVSSPLTLDTVAISGVSQITATTLDTDTINPISGTDVLVNANLDMSANSIESCNELKTDNLTSSTTTKILINSDLDFQNTYNLLNIDSINNIRPSGGLYSQSNLTQFNQTVETNILGGANTSGSLTIPANTFKQLAVYSFKSSGILSGGSNDLFTLRLKSTSGSLFAVLPVTINDNGLNGVWWDLSADFSINTIGAAGVAVLVSTVVFRYINNTNVVSTRAVSNINNTTFDTTISNTLEFTFQNDVTNPLTFLQMNAASFTQWY